MIWELLVILFLVLLNGFLAMSELAIVSSRRTRLVRMVEDNEHGAQRALRLHDSPGRFLSTVQVGITLVGILAGAYSGATLAASIQKLLVTVPAVAEFAEPLALALVVIFITYLSLIAGELVPKRIALGNAERIALLVAPPMIWISRLAAPIVWFLERSTNGLLRLFGLPTHREVTVTEEEVKSLIAEGTKAGVFHAAERDMIDGVLRLADRPVRSIMTPRLSVVWLDPADPNERLCQLIVDSGHSQFPVGKGSIEAIEGVVAARDLLDRALRGETLDLMSSVRTPPFVHDGAQVLKLLDIFRTSAVHMAIIVDEYGTFEGVVTPTDILAAIAGEFPDMGDDAEPSAVQRDDGSWLIDGMLGINEVQRILDRRDLQSEDDYHTLAGFLLWELGHLPRIGERLQWQDLTFEVVDMDGRRIDRVLISQTAQPPAADT